MAKWLYRLESKTDDNGLWYNKNNELVWGIGKLPNCKTKDLPMDYDSLAKAGAMVGSGGLVVMAAGAAVFASGLIAPGIGQGTLEV